MKDTRPSTARSTGIVITAVLLGITAVTAFLREASPMKRGGGAAEPVAGSDRKAE